MNATSAPKSASQTRLGLWTGVRGFQNDVLIRFDRSKKLLRLRTRRKTTEFAIVRIVFGCIR